MSSPDQHPDTQLASETEFVAEALRAEAEAILRIAERVVNSDGTSCQRAIDLLAGCDGHVVVSGMGKSGQIAMKISATFCSLGQPSNVLHPAEAVHGDLGRIRRGDVVMLLSYSGETEEVMNLAAILQADGVPRLGISSNPESSLARLSDVHLSLGDVVEACPLNLAPTASTTAMLALGDALALAVSRRRNFDEDDFHKHHPGGMLGVGLRKVTEILRFRVGENTTTIRGNLTVREACLEARRAAKKQRRAGALLIVDEHGRLTGIFTDGDLRRLVVDDPEGMDRRISEVMTPRPQHLTVDDLVRDAQRVVRERRVDEIPVLDHDGRPVGLIDVQDLIAMKVVTE